MQTITKAGGHASFAKANVADSAEVQAAVKAVVDQWGKINWYSLTDQVDWDTALREDQGHDNPLGLYDLERHIRPVGEAYRKLIQEWRSILPTESSSLRLKR